MLTYSKIGRFGRLGNQLWQIASTIGIARKNETGFIFPDWEYARHFKNQLFYGKIDSGRLKVHKEKTENYYDVDLNKKYDWDLEGYFQSWKYFVDCEDEIKYYFDFAITREPINAVSLHVRRGDYLNFPGVFPVYGLDYYRKALEYFDRSLPIYVFSDDMHWCRRYFKDGIFSDRNIIFDMASADILSLLTMSSCSNHIITNSSFSWWSAYLGINKNRMVVAPSKWILSETDKIHDRIPEGWILV